MKPKFISVCLRALLIVVIASAVGLAFNALSPQGIHLFKTKPERSDSEKAWKEISLEQARGLLGRAVFVDARAREDFEAGHIEGARNLPAHDIDSRIPGFITSVPPELELVVYCSGGDCELSREVAARLGQVGYKRLYLFTTGFSAWKAHNFPTATGPD